MLFGPGMKTVLDAGDHACELFVDKDTKPGGSLEYAPSHMILDRGRLVGLWEFDTETDSIAWMSFIKKNKDMAKAVVKTEEYVRTQLGDAFSPPLLGAVAGHADMNIAFLVIAAAMLVSGVIWLLGMKYLAADTAAVELTLENPPAM